MIALLKWSFDPVEEAKCIKTDAASIRLLALQIEADIKSGRLVPTKEQQAELEEYIDPDFPCYKQYVECARSVELYGSVAAKDVRLGSNLRLKEETVKKGNRVDIVCCRRKLIVITGIVLQADIASYLKYTVVYYWFDGRSTYIRMLKVLSKRVHKKC